MFQLPDLPYRDDALAPILSAEAMRLHHGHHHAGYVKTANTLLAELPGIRGSLEDVIGQAAELPDPRLFNSAAQCWNHSLFWLSMHPVATVPTGRLQAAIAADFGDLDGLKSTFTAAGQLQFGSGWVWLTADPDGRLQVSTTHDAQNPLAKPERTPLLVCDLWEHAYYVDYRNDRPAFLGRWFDSLAHWAFADRQYAAALSGKGAWRHPQPIHVAA